MLAYQLHYLIRNKEPLEFGFDSEAEAESGQTNNQTKNNSDKRTSKSRTIVISSKSLTHKNDKLG